tara:strand:- start:83 stop:772 length:690 start_codon:yes stop_codon:yes gene_type:complete
VNIAILPARSGSERIKLKNIKKFHSKPIIAYPLEKLINLKIFDEIIVSTDSKKIGKISLNYGATSIISRPNRLANNFAPTRLVIKHAINKLNLQGKKIKNVCCIYPCNPFLSKKNLMGAYKIFLKNSDYFVYPIVEYAHPIQRAIKINDKNRIRFINPKNGLKRTQDFAKTYHDAGQFYWATSKTWLGIKNFHSNSFGYPIRQSDCVDIDTADDWKVAERIYKKQNENL